MCGDALSVVLRCRLEANVVKLALAEYGFWGGGDAQEQPKEVRGGVLPVWNRRGAGNAVRKLGMNIPFWVGDALHSLNLQSFLIPRCVCMLKDLTDLSIL